jgi:hypothetical protein
MCTRFKSARVNVTGSSNEVGFEAAGSTIGMVPGDEPKGTTSPMGYRQFAGIALELADLTVGGSTDEPHASVLRFGVEAL